MGLSSNQNSYSLSNSSFKLLIQLINTDSVDEIEDTIFVWFTSKHNSNTKSDKNVIIGWASSYLEFIDEILLSNQKLDLGPW